jgi:hypothetical protein
MRIIAMNLGLAAAIVVAVVATTAPASALLGWLQETAHDQMALTACAKRMHPGLTGEQFDKARGELDARFRTAKALGLAESIHEYCNKSLAINHRIEHAFGER